VTLLPLTANTHIRNQSLEKLDIARLRPFHVCQRAAIDTIKRIRALFFVLYSPCHKNFSVLSIYYYPFINLDSVIKVVGIS
jgi:hypothetical protein